MKEFGDLYSKYYDLLYRDKDYVGEVEYINGLIKIYCPDAITILDMGCGTGRHAELLCNKGFIVHGIDKSENMIKIAQNRRNGKEDRLSFSCANIQDVELGRQFDVIISLFHVMSYQTTNEEVIKVFKTVQKHLNDNGIFIFDFWYGPAVLTDLPVVRVKRLEDESIKVTRIAEPVIYPQWNVVEVNYDLFIVNKETKEFIEVKETHKMRYFFDTELEMICDNLGFKVVEKYEWMSYKKPDFKSWYVVWIVKKEVKK